jgi:hypothetical protein
MRPWKRVVLATCLLALGGCVAHSFQENAALRAAWPQPPVADITAYAAPHADYPTVGGDILKGTSPADLAAAREAAVKPLAPNPGAADETPN